MVWLTVAGGWSKTNCTQNGIQFFLLYGTGLVVAAAGLSLLYNFLKMHCDPPGLILVNFLVWTKRYLHDKILTPILQITDAIFRKSWIGKYEII
jgi:hypothetical protein